MKLKILLNFFKFQIFIVCFHQNLSFWLAASIFSSLQKTFQVIVITKYIKNDKTISVFFSFFVYFSKKNLSNKSIFNVWNGYSPDFKI